MYFNSTTYMTLYYEVLGWNGQFYIHAEMLLSLPQHLVTEGATSYLQDQEDWP